MKEGGVGHCLLYLIGDFSAAQPRIMSNETWSSISPCVFFLLLVAIYFFVLLLFLYHGIISSPVHSIPDRSHRAFGGCSVVCIFSPSSSASIYSPWHNRLLSSLSLHYRHYCLSTFLFLVGSCLSSSTWHPTCTKRKLHSIYSKIKWKTTFRRLSFSRNQLMSFIVIFTHPHSTGRHSFCISSPILCPYIDSLP